MSDIYIGQRGGMYSITASGGKKYLNESQKKRCTEFFNPISCQASNKCYWRKKKGVDEGQCVASGNGDINEMKDKSRKGRGRKWMEKEFEKEAGKRLVSARKSRNISKLQKASKKGYVCKTTSDLPNPWQLCTFGDMNYYGNHETGESMWNHPNTPYCRRWSKEWDQCVDPTERDKVYFYNTSTDESQWDNPDDNSE